MRMLLYVFAGVFIQLAGFSQTDGPYVFYSKDNVYINSIKNGSGQGQLLQQHNSPASVYTSPEKLLVLSDIEGELAGFISLLQTNNVIDDQLNWSYGSGHLAICGDLFDRGLQVTECLWLLYYLEQQSIKKGGRVHVVLGNHDLMNLNGDFRYVESKYFETAEKLGMGYKDLYAKDTELGRWLRSKNVIEQIGTDLFVHGGVSPEVTRLGLTIEQINEASRPWFDKKSTDMPAIPQTLIGGNQSLLWYRGYFMEPFVSVPSLDSTLSHFKATTIIAAHTVLRYMSSFFGGKVIGVDVNHHEGNHQALLIENGIYYRIDKEGKKTILKGGK